MTTLWARLPKSAIWAGGAVLLMVLSVVVAGSSRARASSVSLLEVCPPWTDVTPPVRPPGPATDAPTTAPRASFAGRLDAPALTGALGDATVTLTVSAVNGARAYRAWRNGMILATVADSGAPSSQIVDPHPCRGATYTVLAMSDETNSAASMGQLSAPAQLGDDGTLRPWQSARASITATVTAYNDTGQTAAGYQAGPGICAVDPRVIPWGTYFEVPGYGWCFAADIGSWIQNDAVDVWLAGTDADNWGVQQRTISLGGAGAPAATPTTAMPSSPAQTGTPTPTPAAGGGSGGGGGGGGRGGGGDGLPRVTGKFSSICYYDHTALDDPIVFPNRAGASHSHDFIANATTDAGSTAQSLLGGHSNCTNSLDTAAYWVPTLYADGAAVHPSSVTIYYLVASERRVTPYPPGFKEIAGNAHALNASQASHIYWGCSTTFPTLPQAPSCAAGEHLHVRVDFADCWDGTNLDSPNHVSHVAYSVDGACPAGFPVLVPALSILVKYNTNGGGSVRLASGGTESMHADFFNSWHQDELARLIDTCLNKHVLCPRPSPGGKS